MRRPVSFRKAKRVDQTRIDHPPTLTSSVRLRFPQGTGVSAHNAAHLCHATNLYTHPQGATTVIDCHILRPHH